MPVTKNKQIAPPGLAVQYDSPTRNGLVVYGNAIQNGVGDSGFVGAVGDDASQGWGPLSRVTVPNGIYTCHSAAIGAAVWILQAIE